MIHPAHEGDDQNSRICRAALCKEIGERLAIGLDQKQVRMSAQLTGLMTRLAMSAPGSDRISDAVIDLPLAPLPPDTVRIMNIPAV
jgi:hypothetical protein